MADPNLYLDILDLSEIRTLCIEKGHRRTYAKGECFLGESEVPRELGLVENGYFKYTVNTSDRTEKVVGFSFAGDFIGHINYSMLRLPAGVSIVAGGPATAHVIPVNDFLEFAEGKGLRFCINIEVALFHTLYTCYTDMARHSPRERYLKLTEQYPQLLQLMPLRDIASYIGVTPIHLSRLRRHLHPR